MFPIRALPPLVASGLAMFNAQSSLDIVHQPLECVAEGEYPIIQAEFQPGFDIRNAKVYFRSDRYPKFYFIEMTRKEGNYVSVLPKPRNDTERIIYYIEAVDVSFNTTIGSENVAQVRAECDEREPTAAPGPAEEPEIIVTATAADSPALPPGFEVAGIVGTMTSAGVLSGVGGGPGVGTAIAVGGAAAAGVGGLVAVASGPPKTTTTVSGATSPSTSTIGNTTSAPAGTTTTAGPTTTAISTTTTIGTTTTTSADTTTTTSAPPQTTTTAAALTACFTVSDGDGIAGCKVNFDASCSIGDIVNYEWRFQDNPPTTVSGPSSTASHDWSSHPSCGTTFTRLVRLIVTASDNSTAETQANVNPTSPGSTATIRVPTEQLQSSFTSFLKFPPARGRIEGRVILNGAQVNLTDNLGPHAHRMNGKRGWNTLEGIITSPGGEPVLWRFDFASSEHFEPGSIRVTTGVVVSLDAGSVLLRLTGTSGERVKLRYRLRP